MAFDYTNLYPDTSGNGGYTKSWNYTSVVDNVAACNASGFFNKVATRLGIGDNIVIAQVDAFDKTRTTLLDKGTLFVIGIAAGVVTTINAASLVSPAFTGIPTAPTAAPGTNTTQLATTAYADAISAVLTAALALKAALASPTFTGTPAAPTAAPGTNTTQLANTAFVEAARVILAAADALKATLASPTFTGTPAAPTAAVDTNTTQIATTAMVLGQAASATPLIDGTAAVGTSTRYARGDHKHPTDTTRQALLTAGQLPGTATNDNATAGNVGQTLVSVSPAGNANTATVTVATPCVVTDAAGLLVKDGNGRSDLSPVVFTTTGALPTGITAGTVYYSIPASISGNTFQIATSIANAIAGTALNTTGTQSGTHTITYGAPLTTSVTQDLTALSVPAGEWLIYGNAAFTPAGATVIAFAVVGFNTVSNTLPAVLMGGRVSAVGSTAGVGVSPALGAVVVKLASTTTYFASGLSGFTVSTNNGAAFMGAVRLR